MSVCACVRACTLAVRALCSLCALCALCALCTVRAQTFCGSFLASSWTISNTGDAGDQ